MSQSAAQLEEQKFQRWCFKEAVEIEHRKQKLKEEREMLKKEKQQIEEEKRKLAAAKNEFAAKMQLEERNREQEKRLFNMKWKILEDELKKVAEEKKQVERQKEFYRYVSEHEYDNSSYDVVRGEMFFCGVDNEKALKKRYKDLIKIYHPDNVCGDTTTIQEINCEYEKLLALFDVQNLRGSLK